MSLIKEELHSEFKRYLKYLLLIDIVEILENGRGMIMHAFPEVKLQKLISWFSPIKDSDTYSDEDIKNKISSIGSRLYGDEKLKLLYKSLKTLINTGFSEEDREQRESDVNKLVRKISIYIKNKLTDADIESLDTVFASLDKTASIVTAKIMSELDRYMELPNSPDDTDKKPNKLDVEKSEEDGEEPKKEALHDNFYKRKLKKKIREMIRTAILQKKLRK